MRTTEGQGITKNFIAEEAIPAYRFVKLGSEDYAIALATAASDMIIGASTNVDSEANGRCDVELAAKISEVTYGGAVTRGDRLTADAEGKAVTAASGNSYVGIAMISGVAGDIGYVLLERGVV